MTKMGKYPKKISESIHFRKRLEERFGIRLNREERLLLIEYIQSGQAFLVEKQGFFRRRYRFEIEGQMADIIYHKGRHSLITALYPEGEDDED